MTDEKISLLAEKITALLLSTNRRLQFLCRDTKAGGWDRMMFHELSYGTVAVFGWPELALMVKEKLSGFGCRVLMGEDRDDLWTILTDADYLVNLDKELTVDDRLLSRAKDGVIIVDAAGSSFNEDAVLAALKTDKLAAFASCATDSKANQELKARKNYLEFSELGKEMRG